MDTLPDLRVTIAESVEALAIATTGRRGYFLADDIDALRLMRGAETLRWCAAREAPSIEELQAEIERLEDLIDAVDEAANRPGKTCSARLFEIRDLVA